MNPDEKKRITENLVFFTENTKDIGRLAVHLVSNGLISVSDQQIMNSKPTDSDKLYHMYQEVMKTGRYADLIDILDASGNKLISDKLRSLPSYQNRVPTRSSQPSGEGVNDFVVSRDGITEIFQILGEYPSLKTVWTDIVARKLLSPAKLANLDTNGKFSVIVMRTLDAWKEEKHDAATLQSLVDIIDKENHSAAMALLQKSEQIKNP